MTSSWTERDAHGSLYVYVRGHLVLKTWPSGTQRLFQTGPASDVVFAVDDVERWQPNAIVEKRKVSKLRFYTSCEVFLNGVKLEEVRI